MHMAELTRMVETDTHAEIEALYCHGFDFLGKFIARKIVRGTTKRTQAEGSDWLFQITPPLTFLPPKKSHHRRGGGDGIEVPTETLAQAASCGGFLQIVLVVSWRWSGPTTRWQARWSCSPSNGYSAVTMKYATLPYPKDEAFSRHSVLGPNGFQDRACHWCQDIIIMFSIFFISGAGHQRIFFISGAGHQRKAGFFPGSSLGSTIVTRCRTAPPYSPDDKIFSYFIIGCLMRGQCSKSLVATPLNMELLLMLHVLICGGARDTLPDKRSEAVADVVDILQDAPSR